MIISTAAIMYNVGVLFVLLLNTAFSPFTISDVVAPTKTKIKGLPKLLPSQCEGVCLWPQSVVHNRLQALTFYVFASDTLIGSCV